MADNTSTTCPKRLTRAGLFGIECRIHKVYGISPLAVKVWLAYARAVGCKAPLVEGMLEKAMAAGRRPLDNLRGEQSRVREITYGQRLVRAAIAREERGENFRLLRRQAG